MTYWTTCILYSDASSRSLLLSGKVLKEESFTKTGSKIENQYYLIELGEGGLSRIYDKELNQDIIKPE